jgi:hypothetical protein
MSHNFSFISLKEMDDNLIFDKIEFFIAIFDDHSTTWSLLIKHAGDKRYIQLDVIYC